MWAEVAFANHDTRFSGTCKSFAFLIPGCKSQPVAFSSGLSRYFSPLLLSKFHALGHSLYVQRITNLIFQLGVFMCFMRYFFIILFFFQPTSDDSVQGKAGSLGRSVLGSKAPCYRFPRQQLAKCSCCTVHLSTTPSTNISLGPRHG